MPARAGGWQVLVVPHTHWDREWYLPFQLFRRRLVGVVSEALELLEGDPGFPAFTLDGQAVVLEDYLEVEPRAEARVARQVRAGRLLVGPWYVQPDEFLVSGEALIRNLLMGKRVAARFGGSMEVGYCPDSFGHIAQLPQILRGFGLDSLIFSRGLGDEGEQLGSEFTWEAPDGSQVLAIHQLAGALDRTSGYLNAALLGYPRLWGDDHGPFSLGCAQQHAEQLVARLSHYAHTRYLLFNNGSDHLGLQSELPRILAALNATVPDADFTAATFPEYVGLVASAAGSLPRWSGELRGARYNHILAGVLSTRMPIKQANARAQVALERWAEPFGALAWLEGGPDPTPFLRLAWRLLLHNHAHDSICGCSVDQVHVEMGPRFDQVEQLAHSVAAAGVEHLLGQIGSLDVPDGPLVGVFNPLGEVRTGLVVGRARVPVELHGRPLQAVAADGARGACQVLSAEPDGSALVALSAPSVPSVGYRTLAIQASPSISRVGGDEHAIWNERYRVAAMADGRLRIQHLPTGHVLEGAHLLLDEADAGDEYTFAPAAEDVAISSAGAPADSVLLHAGPALASLAIDQQLWLPAALERGDRSRRCARRVGLPVHTQVSLAADGGWVEIQVEIDNTARDHRLRVVCPTGLRVDSVEALGHFARLRRPVTPPARPGWLEDPGQTGHQQGYVAVTSDHVGVALLSPELPEYAAESGAGGVDLSLTLLRCVGWLSRSDLSARPAPAGPSLPTPHAQCPGRHLFRYAIAVFSAQDAANLPAWAEAYRAPLRLYPAARQAGRLPPDHSLLQVAGPAVLSSVKPAEDGRGIIVRLYNPNAQPATAQVDMPFRVAEAWRCWLDETPLALLRPRRDGRVRLGLGPQAIGTLRLIPW